MQGPASISLARMTPDAAAAAAAAPPPLRRHLPPQPRRSLARPGRATGPRFAATARRATATVSARSTEWDVASGKNIKWKTPIPGIANSSPVIWGNRVFAVTAISKAGDNTFKTGLYGDVKPVDDLSEHSGRSIALDKTSGKILWERTAVDRRRRRRSGTPRAVRPARRR